MEEERLQGLEGRRKTCFRWCWKAKEEHSFKMEGVPTMSNIADVKKD